MKLPEITLYDPYPAEKWAIWYSDLFDRDMPPRIDLQGQGFVNGLTELWARHFFESVSADGRQGLSAFHLHWKKGNITINGDWEGAKRIRHWLFGKKVTSKLGYVAEANGSLLTILAFAHAHLIKNNQPVTRILALAVESKNSQHLIALLYSELVQAD